MKKFLLFFAVMFSITVLFANPPFPGSPLDLSTRPIVKPIDPTKPLDPLPKSPVQVPEVYLDGDTLYFDEALEGCTVQLVDEDEAVVFSDSIAENQTSLVLPATLTGIFELQIVTDQYIFYCEIEL